MLKPLTMSLSLAAALVAGSLAHAGGHGHGVPSAQILPTEQVVASPQGGYTECLPVAKKKCFDLSGLGHGVKKVGHGVKDFGHGVKCAIPKIHLPKPQPKCYSYEWVLQKKRCGGGLLGKFNKCGHGADVPCETAAVYPTAQAAPSPQGTWAAPQAAAAPQAYGAGQTFGTGQVYGAPAPVDAPGVMIPAEGDAAPDAPGIPGI
jgi:hypothetical protein